MKVFRHEPVHRQKALRVSDRLEPAHLALALPRRLMRDLGSVVLVLPGAMHHGRHDGALLHEYESSVHLPRPSDCHDPIANEAGRPNSVIRFKMLHAIDASIS